MGYRKTLPSLKNKPSLTVHRLYLHSGSMQKEHEDAMDWVACRLAELFWKQWLARREREERGDKGEVVITRPDEKPP